MATTLISEKNIKTILEMGLDPAPIIISKGGYYSIANYTLGENLEIITESGPAPAYFYEQIYNPEMIKNLILSPGVTLELTRDVFINGQFTNLGGTVTGGTVYEVNRDLVLSGMGYSWESDLGVTNEDGYAIQTLQSNQSYISFDSVFIQPDNSIIEFTFDILDNNSNSFFVNNGTTNDVIGHVGNAMYFKTGGLDDVHFAGLVTNGKHTYQVRRGVGQNFGRLDGHAEVLLTPTGAISLLDLGMNILSGVGVNFYNFTLDNEVFPCQEGTGTTTTGSLGTVATLVSNASVEDMWLNLAGVSKWVDNIAAVELEAPSPTQRPIYSSADSDFKGLPSLAGESINNRYLTAINLSLGGGDKLTVYSIINNSAVSFVGGQQTVHSLISSSSTNYRQFLGDNGGNHYFEVTSNFQNLSNINTIPNATQSTILSMDGSQTTNELTAYLNGVGDGNRVVNNNSSPVFNVSSFFAFVQSNLANPTDAKLPIILIYPEVHNAAKRQEIEKYITNKYKP